MAITNNTIAITTPASVYTSSGDNAITTLIVCNTGDPTDPATDIDYLWLYAVPNGGTASTATMIVNGLPIPGGETVTFDQEKVVLANGDAIYAVCTTENLSITISTLAV